MPSPRDRIAAQHARLTADPLVPRFLEAFPEGAVVLNGQREIVLVNGKFAGRLGVPGESLLGLRPGQALHCVHRDEEPDGCGTTEFCRYCGAHDALLACRHQGERASRECRITTVANGEVAGALDLEVWATPLVVEDEPFTIFAIRDTSHEKRRQVLERLFFHDLLNAVGGLKGIIDLWSELSAEESAELHREARPLVNHLLEEIHAHRDLALAERGELRVQVTVLDAAAVVEETCATYRHHEVARDKILAVGLMGGPRTLATSRVLLRRVLGNLVKNALEASARGSRVTVSFVHEVAPVFTVHNEGAMSEEVQRRVFQRSFSTKEGTGRGVGTYSVKLLTERYLGGTVAFTSAPATGTTFTVTLPPAP